MRLLIAGKGEAMLEGIKILAADDDVMSLEMLATILGSQGVHCTTVSNGKEAMDALESSPDFDIVLLDLQMPMMDGFEVLVQCKGNPYLNDIPIIVIAAGHHEKLKSLKLGADDFMAKPYDLDELKLRIGKQVQSRRMVRCAKQAKSEFLAIASRELQAPTHQITGLSERLSTENLTDGQQEFVTQLKNTTRNLNDLIDGIFTYVQLDQGTASASMEPFSLRATLHASVDSCIMAVSGSADTFEVAIDADVSDSLNGASLYVSKVFHLLIGHAARLSAGSTLRIAIQEESLGKFGSMFCCSICGSGIGALAEFQDSIFEPFVAVDSLDVPGSENIGLGLAIAKRMVELMGGTIRVKNDEGAEGFFFTFHSHLQGS